MRFVANQRAKKNRFYIPLLGLISLLAITACDKANVSLQGLDRQGKDPQNVVILKTNQGDITVRFFAETTPEHVKNFVQHSQSGYYTNTTFHRVIPGFMIQGGDPNTKDNDPNNDGMGGHSYQGPGTTLDAEFNDIEHTRGILSMARKQAENSAGSQFFIMHQAYPSLNGKYTVFGEVIDGIEVVDLIVNAPRNNRDKPNQAQRILQTLVEQWPLTKIEKTKTQMWQEDTAKQAEAEL